MTDVVRPAPVLSEDNQEFWSAAAQGQLVAQRCSNCGRLRHPPRPMCPHCHSLDHELIELSGKGFVYSYSILHYPQFPMFNYPIVAILVDLAEGVRILSELHGVDPEEVAIGMPVEVRFEQVGDDVSVPVFVRSDS